MSTTLKEWLKQKIASMEATRDEIPFGLDEDDSNTLEALRIALASLEAGKVVLYRERNPYNGLTTGWQELTEDEYEFIKNNAGENAEFRTVYTAPPAPVSVPTFDEWLEIRGNKPLGWVKDAMRESYDACRAAMLQGADGNSPVIPDGWVACSERNPEEVGRYWCYIEEQNDLGKSHYQWNCSWNGDRWWVESENGGRVTHWMPLPAAPQQEVK